ncbi:MAG: methyltransferase, FxLD system [Candidatus Eremiobacteraeota bacterium]|nr:methyltransferase, FxLD system [Candidatus Eremiobacteraeota bacterium]
MTPPGPADLRAQLVAYLRRRGDVRSERVAAAFEVVPRHVFVPGSALEDAYDDRSIAIKLQDGVAISSSSQPAIMAEMLEMLALREGDRVLEIGAGSGYNAALIAEIVGPSGAVHTVDLDEDIIAGARRHLDETGYGRVRTIQADGARGYPGGAPFDAVIATVGVERIPPAWIEQLRLGGRLVAPLTIRSVQKVVAFERVAEGLASVAIVDAAFMMLRGPRATSESVTIALGDPTLTLGVFAAHAAQIDPVAIAAALRTRPHDASPLRRIRIDDVWGGFWLWLALADDACCRVTAYGPTAGAGVVPNLVPGGGASYGTATTLGTCRDGELVIFAPRGGIDVVLRRFGPAAGGVERVQSAIASWDTAGRPGNAQLRVTVDAQGATAIAFHGRP